MRAQGCLRHRAGPEHNNGKALLSLFPLAASQTSRVTWTATIRGTRRTLIFVNRGGQCNVEPPARNFSHNGKWDEPLNRGTRPIGPGVCPGDPGRGSPCPAGIAGIAARSGRVGGGWAANRVVNDSFHRGAVVSLHRAWRVDRA